MRGQDVVHGVLSLGSIINSPVRDRSVIPLVAGHVPTLTEPPLDEMRTVLLIMVISGGEHRPFSFAVGSVIRRGARQRHAPAATDHGQTAARARQRG